MSIEELKNEMIRHDYKSETFIVLESKLAKNYAGYVSIRKDLEFIIKTLKYLIDINSNDKRPILEVSGKLNIKNHDEFLHSLIQSLYFASVTVYGKCFNKAEGRGVKLDKNILSKASIELQSTHDKVLETRNQYVAHGGVSVNEVTIVKLLFPGNGNLVGYPKIAFSGASSFSESENDLISFMEVAQLVLEKVKKKLREVADKLMGEVVHEGVKELYLKALENRKKFGA